ncbi:hypothetical protein BaRGS_00032395 [Batillaria attramentaria]|uniref:Uncharacterized protein n=1 Tax=Batillaria attramentaria TaxID=370345 RepID=A0ABD0JNY4_9CAEN
MSRSQTKWRLKRSGGSCLTSCDANSPQPKIPSVLPRSSPAFHAPVEPRNAGCLAVRLLTSNESATVGLHAPNHNQKLRSRTGGLSISCAGVPALARNARYWVETDGMH